MLLNDINRKEHKEEFGAIFDKRHVNIIMHMC